VAADPRADLRVVVHHEHGRAVVVFGPGAGELLDLGHGRRRVRARVRAAGVERARDRARPRQHHRERAPAALRALHPDAPVVPLGEVAGEREPDARARLHAALPRAVEALEEALADLGRQAGPAVVDDDLDLRVARAQHDLHPPVRWGELECVAQEVREHLLELAAIEVDDARIGGEVELERDGTAVREGLVHLHDPGDERHEILGRTLEAERARVEPNEVEQLVDEREEAARVALGEPHLRLHRGGQAPVETPAPSS
jgi:hypothetical protein